MVYCEKGCASISLKRVEADGDFIVWIDDTRVAATGDTADVAGPLSVAAPNTWANRSVDFQSVPLENSWSTCHVDYVIVEQF